MISKIALKMNLKIRTKNHAADPEIGFLTKSISKPYGCAMAMPPAYEFMIVKYDLIDEGNFFKFRQNFGILIR